jgi:hypothetical protein
MDETQEFHVKLLYQMEIDVYGITFSYDERSKKWFVKFLAKEQADEWIPRM